MRRESKLELQSYLAALCALILAGGLAFSATALAQETTAEDHDATSMEGMSHDEIDDATLDKLRERIPTLAERSNEELRADMKMMPPNYEWYVSDAALEGDVGVLVMGHGYSEVGDKIFKEAVDPLAAKRPATISFGMSMMGSTHVQSAADNLIAHGAKKIVYVPIVQSQFNSTLWQWDYILKLRDEAPYLDAPQVETAAEILRSPPSMDHRRISEILLDHARDISKNEENEVVLIVGHGPENDDDNTKVLKIMDAHAALLRDNSSFADVKAHNLQDDAMRKTRAANVDALRAMVEDARAQGRDVLVVGFLLATGGIQHKIENDLEGLDYTFNKNGMSANPKFALWIEERVETALAGE